MKSKYKIGDLVTIKSKYDEGADSFSYRFNFTETMLGRYGGKSFKIARILHDFKESSKYLPDDSCLYELVGAGFNWASSMFETESTVYPTIF